VSVRAALVRGCRLVAAALLLGGCSPAPTPTPASAEVPALHRFIGADGLGTGLVKRSDLDALWGRPEFEKPMTPTYPSRGLGPWLLMEYKSRGLLFTTAPGSYGQADPRIEMATFRVPFDGCTPQGLCLGMPQEQALAIIHRLYKVTGDNATSFGNSGRINGRTVSARNLGWRRTHYLSFGFTEGHLHMMTFQLTPTPLISMAQLKSGFAWLLGLCLLVLGGLGLEAVKQTMGCGDDDEREPSPAWELGRLGLGAGLLLAAITGMVLGFGALASGDGYAKMFSLMVGLGAAGLAVLALLVFSRSSNPLVSRGASAILLIGLVVLLASKLL
jgi:hypothetical protein